MKKKTEFIKTSQNGAVSLSSFRQLNQSRGAHSSATVPSEVLHVDLVALSSMMRAGDLRGSGGDSRAARISVKGP